LFRQMHDFFAHGFPLVRNGIGRMSEPIGKKLYEMEKVGKPHSSFNSILSISRVHYNITHQGEQCISSRLYQKRDSWFDSGNCSKQPSSANCSTTVLDTLVRS